MTTTFPRAAESKEAIAHRNRWVRIAVWLVVATMAYNVVEAAVALVTGFTAGSIALLGFGFDSVIEMAAAAALLWRLRLESVGTDSEAIEQREQRVHHFIGATFVALAVYVVLQTAWTLLSRQAPEESPLGIILAVASLIIMPAVSWGKLRAASHIGSRALAAEARASKGKTAIAIKDGMIFMYYPNETNVRASCL
jgi:divalent metal cation (Fe/Co/Zn/Cd) transporter